MKHYCLKRDDGETRDTLEFDGEKLATVRAGETVFGSDLTIYRMANGLPNGYYVVEEVIRRFWIPVRSAAFAYRGIEEIRKLRVPAATLNLLLQRAGIDKPGREPALLTDRKEE